MINKIKIQTATKLFLEALGEDPKREGLIETPRRVANMWEEFLSNDFKPTTFTQKYDEMIFLGDIPFFSFCEHHLLPFTGKAYIAYIPDKKVIGLSKIARILYSKSQRLQMQERLTAEVANEIKKLLKPLGVAVVIKAEHMCMSIRGVKAHGAVTVTSCLLDAFREKSTRAEFMSLVGR